MAKSVKYATPICLILSIVMIVSIIAAFILKNPLIIALALLPVAIYEAYRTEGVSTKWASWGMVLVLALLNAMLIFKINFDLTKIGKILGLSLGNLDARAIIPVVMAILAIVLVKRTAGMYTRWLAIIIFISCIPLFYLIDPALFSFAIKKGAEEGSKYIKTR